MMTGRLSVVATVVFGLVSFPTWPAPPSSFLPYTWSPFGGLGIPNSRCASASASEAAGCACNGIPVVVCAQGLKCGSCDDSVTSLQVLLEASCSSGRSLKSLLGATDSLGGNLLCVAPGTPPIEPNAGKPGFCPSANPVNPGTGNKFQVDEDYAGTGGHPLVFRRAYNSTGGALTRGVGVRWQHYYDRAIVGADGNPPPPGAGFAAVYARTWDGKVLRYVSTSATATELRSPSNPAEVLTRSGTDTNTTGWELRTASDDQIEQYDGRGRLVGIRARSGLVTTLAYDGAGRLQSVTDPFGRMLAFAYDQRNQIAEVAEPGGEKIRYTYEVHDLRDRLIAVTYPDGATRRYHYEDPRFPFAVTGVTDENAGRFATWSYDDDERVVESAHAGGVERYRFGYDFQGGTAGVTDPNDVTRTHAFQISSEVVTMTGITGPANAPCSNPPATSYAGLYPSSISDYNGQTVRFERADPQGRADLETLRVEAAGSAEERRIATEWHPFYRLPLRVAEPLRITTYAYGEPTDANPGNRGSVLARTVQATSDATGALGFSASPVGTPRTWTYTYNQYGRVLTVDGPRTDVSDITTYAYYPSDDPDLGRRGNVATITNAAGHVTQIAAYNPHGQPLATVDPNGSATALAYDSRRRLISRSVGGETTTYDYDGVGQVAKVTLPGGSFLVYTYDPAHRLTQIADNLGNRISYTLDTMGNRIREDVFDPLNQLAQTRSRMYSSLNRLDQEIGGTTPSAQVTRYGYDNQGNVTSISDPLNRVTTNAYDALNRLKQVTDPASGVTRFEYDGQDQLALVTDPRNNATRYSVDGLGNFAAQSSPDTGSTANTYDAAGNVAISTDAKGQSTSYAYDALNRVTRTVYNQATGAQLGRVDYVYDQGADGIGRLTSISETSAAGASLQTTAISYDQRGRVASEARAIGGVTYTTRYTHDAAGRMTGMTYPSGRALAYGLDGTGRVSRIETTGGGTTEVVVQDVAYRPFGSVNSFTFGNLQAHARSFDLDGRIVAHSLPDQTKTISLDAASRITRIGQQGAPTNFANYGYDLLDRLTSTVLATSTFSFGYDAVGNRLSKFSGAGTDTYSYPATSNRLAQVSGSTLRTYTHDANGSITAYGANALGYDARGRLVSSTSAAGAASYQVNALGQRVRKTSSARDAVYHYDTQGRLIGESDATGSPIREYLYLGDQPVAAAVYPSGSGSQCPAQPALDRSDTFVAFARRERMEVHSGRPGERGWEWGLGTNTRNFDASARADLDWVSGKPYGFVLSYDGAGNARVRVSDGATELFSLTWTGGMDVGNALRFMVKSPAGIGAGNRISVTITGIDGQPVSESLATAGNDALSEVAHVYAGTSLQNGYVVEGTVTFVFNGRYPPRGNQLDFTVTAGKVTCQGSGQAGAPVLHYVHTDHLNTPRVVADSQQRVVWRWENQEPFGNNPPEENPSGLGNFEFPLRFAGQYFDRETGLFYNYFRDYDPQTGRYVQSDPIGLAGGINPYAYAYDDPVRFSDPMGLDVHMCKRPLRVLGGSGTRSGPDIFGNPLYHQYACVVIGGTQICGGQTIERASESEWWPWGPGLRSDDRFNPDTCTKRDDSVCMDNCMMSAIANPYRPSYGLFGPGTNCQEWADDALAQCRRKCRGQR